MTKLIIASTTAIALIAGIGAASAQSMQNDGPNYRGRMIERNVGLQTEQGWNRGWTRSNSGSTYESRSFRSQEVWPQSPPTGS